MIDVNKKLYRYDTQFNNTTNTHNTWKQKFLPLKCKCKFDRERYIE